MSNNKATICALAAIIIWSSIVALVRSVSLHFGPVLGAALIYTISSIVLLYRQNLSELKTFPKAYLYGCGFLFVAYEILFTQSIGLAKDSQQTLEIGLINYLWPCLVVLFAVPINKQKACFALLIPGVLLSVAGIVMAMCGEEGFSPASFWQNIASNPVAYTMVLIAAVFWGLYCNFSKKYGEGKNGVSLFCLAIAIVLWLKFFLDGSALPAFNLVKTVELVITGVLFGASYWLWENGIQNGNMMFIAIISYFTPLFSTIFASFWLSVLPTNYFWFGTLLVIAGAILCWRATK